MPGERMIRAGESLKFGCNSVFMGTWKVLIELIM
jgi:hypothetical protein